jgi:hypothetical protein
MPDDVSVLVSSLSTAVTIAKTLVSLRDSAKLNDKIIELQQPLLDANAKALAVVEKQLSLLSRNDELEKECVRLKDWSAERQNYELKEIAVGAFAYVEKDFVGQPQSARKLCCNCYDQTVKSLLQQSREPFGGRNMMTVLTCPRCKTKLGFTVYKPEENPPTAPQPAPIFPN